MKVAIVRLSALGDIIHSALVLEQIKKAYPNSHITWFCDESFCEILSHSPFLDEIVALPIKRLSKEGQWITIFRRLRELKNHGEFDTIIDMQGLLKSALVTFFLRGVRCGFDFWSARERVASLFYHKKAHIAYSEHIFLRNIKLASFALGIGLRDEDITSKSSFLGYSKSAEQRVAELVFGCRRVVLFLIGASKPAKQYPKESFLALANELEADIFLAYKGQESARDAHFIVQNSKNVKAALDLSLDELKALISRASLVIGADSGPTHIAWAMGVPSITIFGNTPSRRFCPNTPKNRCIGGESVQRSSGFDKSDFSITKIAPQDVAKLARELLGD